MNFKSDLRKQIIYELKDNGILFNNKNNTYQLLICYLNVINRIINARPRKVFISDNVKNIIESSMIENKLVDGAYIDSLKDLKVNFIKGIDVTEYLSKNIYSSYLFDNEQHPRIIQKKLRTEKAKSRDDLLAENKIHHIHVVKKGSPDERKEYLLFAIVTYDSIYFIDVKEHKTENFADDELVETVIRNWPHLTKRNRLANSRKICIERRNSDVVRENRKKNELAFQGFNSRIFMPLGGGLMSDGTPIVLVKKADSIFQDIRFFEMKWKEIEKKFKFKLELKIKLVQDGFIITNLITNKSIFYYKEDEELVAKLI